MYMQLEKAAKMAFVRKTHAFYVDKIDGRSPKSNLS